METISRIMMCEPARASSVAPWLPPAFDAFFARAFAREIDARLPTADAMRVEIEALPRCEAPPRVPVARGRATSAPSVVTRGSADAARPSWAGQSLVFDGRCWRTRA
jgi:hypothetical protein